MLEIEPVIIEEPNMPHPVPLRYVSNLTRIGQDLEWKPEIGIDDGLRMVF